MIDIQKDFHPIKDKDGNETSPLAVSHANEDAQNVVKNIIEKHIDQISHITVTMDTHEVNDIGHSNFWVRDDTMDKYFDEFENSAGPIQPNDDNGDAEVGQVDPKGVPLDENFRDLKHPPPFSSIVYKKWEGLHGKKDYAFVGTSGPPDGSQKSTHFWTPKDASLRSYCAGYLKELQSSSGFNKLQHTIWPCHCLEGSEGHNVQDDYQKAFDKWSAVSGKDVFYVFKGTNRLCEMYSAFRAEVPVQGDYSTYTNVDLIRRLRGRTDDPIVIAGQATGYSVRFTVEDLLRLWPVDSRTSAEDLIKDAKINDQKRKNFEQLSDLPHKDVLRRRIYLLEDGMSDIPSNVDGKEIGPGVIFKEKVRGTVNITTCDAMSKILSEPVV